MLNFFKTFVDILSEFKTEFLIGLGTTILISVVSLFFAVLIGLTVGYLNFIPVKKAGFKSAAVKVLQWIGKEYIDLIRGTPLLVQAIFFYFGLVPIIAKAFFGKGQMMPEIAGIIIISLNAGAFLAEIFRGGIQAIDPGQMEA